MTIPKPQPQVGGTHYEDFKIQPIEAMEAWLDANEFKGYLRCNIIKYIVRYPHKGRVQDLEKANWYLEKLIEIETRHEKLWAPFRETTNKESAQ